MHRRHIRRPRAVVAIWVAVIAAGAWMMSGVNADAAPRVTVIGDSVQASFAYTPQAVRNMGRGLDLRMEARACRRLSSAGCITMPPSAVLLAQSLGPRLGDVVVVHVGYNDYAGAYNTEAAMAAFRRAGVRAVVWVALREAQSGYAAINARIRDVARRAARRGDQPLVRVADWNRYSSGNGGWFTSDRVHLNASGAMGLSALLREEVLSVLAEMGTSIDGRPVTTRVDTHRLGTRAGTIAAGGDALWVSDGRRLVGRDDHNGHALRGATRLGATETLVGDGRAAWWHDRSASGALTRVRPAGDRRGRTAATDAGTAAPLLAGDGTRVWSVSTCDMADAAACPTGERLRRIGVRGDDGLGAPLRPGTVTHVALGRNALWVAAVDPAGRARLERRDRATGRLLRTTRLAQRPAALAAGPRGAWVLTARGDLLRVGATGRTKRMQRGLAAVAATGNQLWAVRRDRRTVVNLHPVTTRVRGTARAGVRLSATMAITNRHVWVLSDSGRHLVRLPRA